jgi:hypothetical protein
MFYICFPWKQHKNVLTNIAANIALARLTDWVLITYLKYKHRVLHLQASRNVQGCNCFVNKIWQLWGSTTKRIKYHSVYRLAQVHRCSCSGVHYSRYVTYQKMTQNVWQIWYYCTEKQSVTVQPLHVCTMKGVRNNGTQMQNINFSGKSSARNR